MKRHAFKTADRVNGVEVSQDEDRTVMLLTLFWAGPGDAQVVAGIALRRSAAEKRYEIESPKKGIAAATENTNPPSAGPAKRSPKV